MKLDKTSLKIYAITPKVENPSQLVSMVREALEGGATCIQIRDKSPGPEFLGAMGDIKALCKEYNAPFIINDNVDLAIKCKADGVHLGQEDMGVKEAREKLGSQMIIGISANNVEAALEAEKNGADYIGAGAVFPTYTKSGAKALSHSELKDICNAVKIPVVAIGGITSSNFKELEGTGIDGVAVISNIFGAENIKEATEKFKDEATALGTATDTVTNQNMDTNTGINKSVSISKSTSKSKLPNSKTNLYKLTLAGMLVALGVVASPLYIPIGAAKCFPVQHMINIIAAILLGPSYGVGMAFTTSIIRVSIGTGSFLAFPGSMCGALLSGLAYKHTRKSWLAYGGEIIGTGILGALIGYPVATYLMGKEASLFFLIIPFMISTLAGATIGILVISALKKTKIFENFNQGK